MDQPVDEQRSCHGKKRYADAEVANVRAVRRHERGPEAMTLGDLMVLSVPRDVRAYRIALNHLRWRRIGVRQRRRDAALWIDLGGEG